MPMPSGNAARHATLWQTRSTTAIDLNTLVALSNGAYLSEAEGINDRGQIIAQDSNGYAQLMTLNVAAVPVPATT